MSKSVILAGASVRSLAESAVRCGISPACIDMFGDADLRLTLQENGHPEPIRINQFTEIPAAIEHVPPEIPLVWTGGMENHLQTLRRIRKLRPVFGPTTICLNVLRSVPEIRALFAGTECRVPDIWLRSAKQSELADSGEWLVKPVASSGGMGIRRFESGIDVHPGEFLQEYIPGIPVSALYHCQNRRTQMLGACVQITGEPAIGGCGFKFCGTVGPVDLPDTVRSTLSDVGRRIGLTEIQGVFGADFIVSKDGIWLIEVNPRITASHESYDFVGTELSVLQRHLASWSNAPQSFPAPLNHINSDRILARLIIYLKQDGSLDDSRAGQLLEFRRPMAGRRNPQFWLADIPPAGNLILGQPFCSVYHVLRKSEYGWTTDADIAQVIELDAMLSLFTGVAGLNTLATAMQYGSLFERAV